VNQLGDHKSFLDRDSGVRLPFFGVLRNYHLIAVLLLLVLAFVPRGARFAIQTQSNDVRHWLPSHDEEARDLRWFQKHFVTEQFALVSWDDCTLGNSDKLRLLAGKLVPKHGSSPGVATSPEPEDNPHRYFSKVMTGPEVLEQLTSPPLSLEWHEAIRRLEGSLVGPLPEGARDDDERTTCMVVTLSKLGEANNHNKRAAIEAIERLAVEECSIPAESLHMGGPPVDNVAIDIEGERTLVRLAGLSGVAGLVLSYLCFRSFKLMFFVFLVGGISAAMSLAIVRYVGIYEVLIAGLGSPHFGTVDAVLMSMPAVVYVLGLSGAIHIVNYYRDARDERGRTGAAEEALRHGWKPCALAALTTAVGLGSLYISDIMPIKKFGIFTAVGVITTLLLLFALLPLLLHRFPPKIRDEETGGSVEGGLGGWYGRFEALMHRAGGFIIRRNGFVAVVCLLVMATVGYGLTKTRTRVQLLKLFDPSAEIIADYAWLEEHLGPLVPMEVVLRIGPEHQRSGNEDAEADGRHYKMNRLERTEFVQNVQRSIESLRDVGSGLSSATFGPDLNPDAPGFGSALVDPRRVINLQLERYEQLHQAARTREEESGEAYAVIYDTSENEARLLPRAKLAELPEDSYEEITEGDYRRVEPVDDGGLRELYRISSRLEALNDVDYGVFVENIRAMVEPVLEVYRARDMVLARLHAEGKLLRDSRTCILVDVDFRPWQARSLVSMAGQAAAGWHAPLPVGQHDPLRSEKLLHELLKDAGSKPAMFNLADVRDRVDDPQTLATLTDFFAKFDCVVLSGTGKTVNAAPLVKQAPVVIDAADMRAPTGEQSLSSVYTGIVPLVYQTQRKLLNSLVESSALSCAVIALVMIIVLRSAPAGMISMLPNVFPIVLVFGAMGWLGVKVDIGIMMTASVALGVAVDDTVHFLTWFRDGISRGMDRKGATMLAYERCATAMFQTTVIGGLGLSVFAASTFTPTQQFGILMVTLLSAALIGDLIFLPALLCSPIGRFFGGGLQKPHRDETGPVQQQPSATSDQPDSDDAKHPATPRHHLRQDLPHSSAHR